MLVECLFFEQLLHGEVHAVVPEVVRVSGHVDTLGMRVCQTHFLVYRQPVLQRQNHPHRGRVHVLVHDELGYLRFTVSRTREPEVVKISVKPIGEEGSEA